MGDKDRWQQLGSNFFKYHDVSVKHQEWKKYWEIVPLLKQGDQLRLQIFFKKNIISDTKEFNVFML